MKAHTFAFLASLVAANAVLLDRATRTDHAAYIVTPEGKLVWFAGSPDLH